MKRLIQLVLMLFLSVGSSAYIWVKPYKLGETFTVSTSFYESNTYRIEWSYDSSVLQPVSYIGQTNRSVTFKVIDASPSAGSAIHVITWYYKTVAGVTGLMSSPTESWLVHAIDDTTVSFDYDELTMDFDNPFTLKANLSNTASKTKFEWRSSPTGIVSISSSGNKAKLTAKNSGKTTVKVTLDNGNSAECQITVISPVVESATVTPSYIPIDIDKTSSPLSLSVSPSNATVTSKLWKSKNSNIASVSSSGEVTGVSAGSTEIYCVVNGSVTSNSCYVTVSKPSFTLSSSSPTNNATGLSVFTCPSLTFCRGLYKGTSFSDISVKDNSGKIVEGEVSISGSTLTFVPTVPLEANTCYTFNVPASAIKDKYGTGNSAVTRTFTTGNLQKLTLKTSKSEKFLSMGEKIKLTSNVSNVIIYYTLDGSIPTEKSTKYQGEIILNRDIQLRAIAVGTGYESSDVLMQDYYITNVNVVKSFPDEDTKMYVYKDVNPHIKFSNKIEQSGNLGQVKLKMEETMLDADAIVTDSTLYIVPSKPLQLGHIYTVSIPEDAVRTWQGESCREVSWSFTTGYYAKDVSIGNELAVAVMTDGSLWTWGQRLKNVNAADGSYEYITQNVPASFVASDVVSVSAGYMHHALLKRDGSLWMWGRQLCGEFGNGSTAASAEPIKVMENVKSVNCGLQLTAIVKNDSSLWMCGRNDLCQIDSSYTVKTSFVKVAEDVNEIELQWGGISIVKNDGSIVTRIWNDTIDALRKPEGELDNAQKKTYGWKNAIALGTDGSVWTWGNNDTGTLGAEKIVSCVTPMQIIEGRKSSVLNGLTTDNISMLSINTGEKAVLSALPDPLDADYDIMFWHSSDSTVVRVNEKGVISGVSRGMATVGVHIHSNSGKSYYKDFHVMVDLPLCRGDVNGDGVVNGTDIQAIINLVVEGEYDERGDVNEDGTVNGTDIQEVINIIVNAE